MEPPLEGLAPVPKGSELVAWSESHRCPGTGADLGSGASSGEQGGAGQTIFPVRSARLRGGSAVSASTSRHHRHLCHSASAVVTALLSPCGGSPPSSRLSKRLRPPRSSRGLSLSPASVPPGPSHSPTSPPRTWKARPLKGHLKLCVFHRLHPATKVSCWNAKRPSHWLHRSIRELLPSG